MEPRDEQRSKFLRLLEEIQSIPAMAADTGAGAAVEDEEEEEAACYSPINVELTVQQTLKSPLLSCCSIRKYLSEGTHLEGIKIQQSTGMVGGGRLPWIPQVQVQQLKTPKD
ncbi:hypothetical protein JOB18_016878 [Solea senegalensis]|uniref:Uncharacterized protein n=1 Tax=Solea senegalensis TaxID=28829 RepID=A0AAV6SLR9_SOLSE|nr:hypothetical protein JOB18_016878 [Solea senegalensis]